MKDVTFASVAVRSRAVAELAARYPGEADADAAQRFPKEALASASPARPLTRAFR